MHTQIRPFTCLNGSELKGISSEDRAEVAIRLLRKHRIFYRYIRTETSDRADRAGIDFIIWSTVKKHHLLQVKSSEVGKSYHKIKYADGIPCVVALLPYSVAQLARMILEELELDTTILDQLVEKGEFI